MPTIYDNLKCRIKIFQFYGLLTEKRTKTGQKCRCLFRLHGILSKILFLIETLIFLWFIFAIFLKYILNSRRYYATLEVQSRHEFNLMFKILGANFLTSIAAYVYLLKKSSNERYMVLLNSIDTAVQPKSAKQKIKIFFKYLFFLVGMVLLVFSWGIVQLIYALDGRYSIYDTLVPNSRGGSYLFFGLVSAVSSWWPILIFHVLVITANIAGFSCNFFKRIIDEINLKLDKIRNDLECEVDKDPHEFAKKVENAQKEYDLLEQLAIETNKVFSPIVFAVFAVSFLFISEVQNEFNKQNGGHFIISMLASFSFLFTLMQASKCIVAACVCNRKRQKFVSQLQTARYCQEMDLPEDLVTCRLNHICWTVNTKITGHDWMTMGGGITFSLNLLWVITQRLAICTAFQTKWIAYWFDREGYYYMMIPS